MADHLASPPWYAGGLRFTCTQCGNCCGGGPGYVWVSPEEEQAIADYLDLTVAEFHNRHIRVERGDMSLLEHDNGDCEFLVRDPATRKAGCSIYSVRPVQCRTWPFWKSNVRSERMWMSAARTCPGMNQGQHHPLPVIQQAVQRGEDAGLAL